MKTLPVAPYLLPPEECVAVHPWTLEDGQPVPERFDHWDPYTPTDLFRTVEVNLDAVRQACALGPDATFALTASWTSDRTRLAGISPAVELGTLSGAVQAPLHVSIPGAASGGRLSLLTRLVLRYPGEEPTAISPRRQGAILWTQQTRVLLEGAASRFPVAAIDFSSVAWLPDNASWAVEWELEMLDAPVLSALRLVINADDTALLQALRSGSTDPRAATIRSFVMFDVARTLVDGALRSDHFVSDPESFDEGTVGRMLFDLLATCWPGIPVSTLVTRSRQQPAQLIAELQAHLRVLR